MSACNQKRNSIPQWVFFALVVLLTIGMDIYVANNLLDGDASQPFVKGWVMAQQKNLFTSDIYLTTEVRILDTSTVAALLFTFISDWTLVRILTMVTLQAWYVLSFLYLCRQSGLRLPQSLIAAGMLLLPFSIPYARVVLYHMYYLQYMAVAFWLLGLTLRLLAAGPGQKRSWTWVLLGASWMLAGFVGIRYMMILGIPVLAFAGIQLLFTLRDYRWENGKLTGEKPIGHTRSVRLLVILLVSCVCFMIGFVVNHAVLLPYFGVKDVSSAFFYPNVTPEHYTSIWNGWLVAIGIRCTTLPLMSKRALGLIGALVALGYLLVSSLRSCFRKGVSSQGLMHSMLGASFITTTLIFVFESSNRVYELYYVPVVAMAVPALAVELGRLKEDCVSACRKLLILLVCACFLCQSAYSLYFILTQKEVDEWRGLTHTDMDTIVQVQDCVDFMQQNGYTHGFIDYWYANAMIEMSDGTLYVAPIEPDYQATQTLRMYRWGTCRSAFEQENMPAKVLVFIKHKNADGFEIFFPDARRMHEGSDFIGYEVDAELIE